MSFWRRSPSKRLDLETGDPFWRRRDGLPRAYSSLAHDTQADVVIAGAGCTGAMLAHELSRSGVSVVVLDRRDVASGSSAASTGLLLYDTDTSLAELARRVGPDGALRVYHLGLSAIRAIERFCSSSRTGCGYSRRSSLYLASRRRDVRPLRKEFESRRSAGFAVSWLDQEQITRSFGFHARAAIRSVETAEVDTYRLTHELLEAATERGARVFGRTEIRSFEGSRGDFTIRTDRGASVRCDSIIWATGYEGITLAGPRASLASTWVLVTEPLAPADVPQGRHLVWETARPYLYLRWTEDNRLLVGGEDEPCADCHRNSRWFRSKTSSLLARAQSMFPHLRLEIAYAWAGTFSLTKDGLPIIAERPRFPGQWLALGYGGNGITFGAIAARLITDAILGKPSSDLSLFEVN